MKIAVQKFGGTSVANDKVREEVVKKIIKHYDLGYKIVVVVSAMGREKDSHYATDSLLKLVDRKNLSDRELDLLMACGEIISGVVLADLLSKKGYHATVLTGQQAGIITNDKFGEADVLRVSPKNVIRNLKEGSIVIVTGFQGATEEGDITTLGRGGSDTSAVLLGEALKCEFVEIFTDVDGIMTADPRIVPDARLLEKMCYSDVYQLAEDGAKVIHPRAVEVAERSNIKLIVKNTMKNESPGTLIRSRGKSYSYGNAERVISAITYKGGRAQVVLYETDNDKTEQLMSLISERNISIDLINFFKDKKVFTIDHEDVKAVQNILENTKVKYEYKIIDKCCKLSIIGNRMRGIPGVMARVMKSLSKSNIEILQTSDSHTTIWCLIKDEDLEVAVNSLHKEFNLYKK